MVTLRSRRFVFVTGVAGSGTNLLLDLLSSPTFALALGGNYVSPDRPDYECSVYFNQINALTRRLWANEKPRRSETARIKRAINGLPVPEDGTHVAYQRSYPFWAKLHRPRLADVLDLGRSSRIIVLERDLRKCAASILRRNYATTIEEAAARVDRAWRTLRDQIARLPSGVSLTIQYDDLVGDQHASTAVIEAHFGYPSGSLPPYLALVGLPTRESSSVAETHRTFLDGRFSS